MISLAIFIDNYEMNELKVIHRIQSHVGSIKSIAFVMDKCLSWQRSKAPVTKQMPKRRPLNYNSFGNFVDVNQPYLLFTCGSRTSLKCSCIIFDKHFDHISSFLVSEIGNREKKRRNNAKGNDLRFMSLQVISLDMYNNFQNSSQFYCIVVGCSDGYIRFVLIILLSSPSLISIFVVTEFYVKRFLIYLAMYICCQCSLMGP